MRACYLLIALLFCACRTPAPEQARPTFEPPVLTATEPAARAPLNEGTPLPTSAIKTRPLPLPQPTPTPRPPRPKKKVHKPSFVPKRDYPTYEPELLSQTSQKKILGVPGEALDQNEARPIYHPAVTFHQRVDRPSLDVQFQVAADGSCTAVLLTTTGDAGFDRHAVQTLNSWRWRARQENGRYVASTEVVRLRRTR